MSKTNLPDFQTQLREEIRIIIASNPRRVDLSEVYCTTLKILNQRRLYGEDSRTIMNLVIEEVNAFGPSGVPIHG